MDEILPFYSHYKKKNIYIYNSTNKVHILELGIGLYPGKGRR